MELTKDEIIAMILNGKIRDHIQKGGLLTKGQRYRYAELFNISKEDLQRYFEKTGYPVIRDKDAAKPPFFGDCETFWTIEDGVYKALFVERGTMVSDVYSDPDRDSFQRWWNNHILDAHYFSMTYPWTWDG